MRIFLENIKAILIIFYTYERKRGMCARIWEKIQVNYEVCMCVYILYDFNATGPISNSIQNIIL